MRSVLGKIGIVLYSHCSDSWVCLADFFWLARSVPLFKHGRPHCSSSMKQTKRCSLDWEYLHGTMPLWTECWAHGQQKLFVVKKRKGQDIGQQEEVIGTNWQPRTNSKMKLQNSRKDAKSRTPNQTPTPIKPNTPIQTPKPTCHPPPPPTTGRSSPPSPPTPPASSPPPPSPTTYPAFSSSSTTGTTASGTISSARPGISSPSVRSAISRLLRKLIQNGLNFRRVGVRVSWCWLGGSSMRGSLWGGGWLDALGAEEQEERGGEVSWSLESGE